MGQLGATKLVIALIIASLFSAYSQAQTGQQESYTLSGKVYVSEGELAGSTSVKVSSMDSVWSEGGAYSIAGIDGGEVTARAYFMNDGHTVVYRKVMVESDMTLDWYKDKNWVTFDLHEDSAASPQSIRMDDGQEATYQPSILGEFGPLDIGIYYTMTADYQDGQSEQVIHFRMEAGSSSNPAPNHFTFNHGHNSIFGFLRDSEGAALADVVVAVGEANTVTNDDGFYLLQNLMIGSSVTLNASHWGNQIMEPLTLEVPTGEGWLNLTAEIEKSIPELAEFNTQIITTTVGPTQIEWSGGNFTDYYSLYMDGDLVYRGYSHTYLFLPQVPGSFQFSIEASNPNGSIANPMELKVIVLPGQDSSDLWSTGMVWNYTLTHTPYFQQNKSYTTIGSEPVEDAFGNPVDSYLLRVTDTEYEEGEKAFRWVDAANLMTVHTHWVDSPLVSSYYQEGFLGWRFTDSEGAAVNPLAAQNDEQLFLHFNRTNVIGVPGHPNGYDDTTNTVRVVHGVQITTIAGNFTTTYLEITDQSDGVISWEMWYNETVRNWVKVVDRIPGSHSDMVEWELTSFKVPLTPQFITQDDIKLTDDDFTVEWALFQGAEIYELRENGELIYTGGETSFKINDRQDGTYTYDLTAVMETGTEIAGDSVQLQVSFVLEPPVFETDSLSVEVQPTLVRWGPVEDAYHYTVVVIDSTGNIEIAYEGPSTEAQLDSLQPGINRVRVMASMADGTNSDYSDSIFITVSDTHQTESTPIATMLIALGLILFTAAAIWRRAVR